MVWCSYCAKDQQAERDDINGFTCCTGCGSVLDDNVYGNDPTFTKTAGGQSQVEGNFVKDGQSNFGRLGVGGSRILGYQSDSHEKTLAKGRHEIVEIIERLSIGHREDVATQAHRFYTIALERNFTRGRRTQHVAASTIYIVCRQNNRPYMLIDFSDCLQTNVYVLGAVFLQLCNLLRLEEQPFMQKPVDPSLFIHRFADRLQFGKKMHTVANTALRLVASMKRDWMQTGRRPSGICGAALFISAHMHGFERSKGDVVSVVHICEATLKRRLVEFESTESGSLTAEEFEVKGREMEAQVRSGTSIVSFTESTALTEILCEHKDMGVPHFSRGLCRQCYEEFVKVSGGMQGGSAPPAFQRAELQRMQTVRDQLKSQGLNSDDDEENESQFRLTMYKKGRGGGRGRGRGRGGGRGSKTHASGLDCKDVPDATGERFEKRGRGRPRGRGRGSKRGKSRDNSSSSAGEQAEMMDAEHPEAGEHDASGRVNGKKRGLSRRQAAESSELGDIQSEVTCENRIENADAGNTPDDDDVLWPIKFPPKRKQESKLKKIKREDAPAVHSKETDVNLLAGAGDDTPAKKSKSLTVTSSRIGSVAVPSENGIDKSAEASRVGGSSGSMEKVSGEVGFPATSQIPAGGSLQQLQGSDDWMNDENLSDIDDDELTGYMNNDEEVRLKTIIWSEMNKDYLQEQEAKEAALAALEETRAAAVAAAASNSASAAELAAAAAAAVAQMKKDRKQRKVDDAKRPPAESAAEATRQMLESKRLSTKVDYSVLAKLFDTAESENRGNAGKNKQDDDPDNSEAQNSMGKRIQVGSQGDVSQADSVITQISAGKSLTKEVDSKDGSVDVVNINDDEAEIDEEEDYGLEDDVNGMPYDYDDTGDYSDEY